MFGYRNDAKKVKDMPAFNRFLPYLMPKRVDSLVYFSMEVDMTKAMEYVRTRKRLDDKHQIRAFNIILGAMVRTTALFPRVNRFINNRVCYQRNDISFNFIVKTDMSIEATERNALVNFEEPDTIDEMARKINSSIEEIRSVDTSKDEAAIRILLHFPKTIIKMFVGFIRILDRWGIYPKSFRDTDGLHVTAFVANVGSINIENPPSHHLYSFGTTSMFVTLGKIKRNRITQPDGTVKTTESMDIGFTVDERVADGFYFSQVLRCIKRHIEHPELLEEKPDLSQQTL